MENQQSAYGFKVNRGETVGVTRKIAMAYKSVMPVASNAENVVQMILILLFREMGKKGVVNGLQERMLN